ncbi:hypothetical protein C9374_008820 [Naegleria lovaniensis]|uniref:Uncharacterized protein n=1 Tax=Naegleria lovaniensis TaxID=51637 RepID=A0AA88GJ37_NAELO|nr:uncharacterized protein C9374_008820 [Naegleria lovaniensis]KAG2377735.1 hypothetical protein C9374_008820 [Naegleria lovaniensis]
MSSLSAYEELDLDKLTIISLDKYEGMDDDFEIETTNKLYRLRPLPQWDTVEQEEGLKLFLLQMQKESGVLKQQLFLGGVKSAE